MAKERLLWPDAVRGLLILIVILGHSLQHGDYEHNILWNIIYSFHMAAFFAISGFVSYKPELGWNIIWKRARQLVIPLTIWGVLHSICLKKSGFLLFDFLVYPDRGYWFLYTLFIIIALFVCLDKLSNRLMINNLYCIMGGVFC